MLGATPESALAVYQGNKQVHHCRSNKDLQQGESVRPNATFKRLQSQALLSPAYTLPEAACNAMSQGHALSTSFQNGVPVQTTSAVFRLRHFKQRHRAVEA